MSGFLAGKNGCSHPSMKTARGWMIATLETLEPAGCQAGCICSTFETPPLGVLGAHFWGSIGVINIRRPPGDRPLLKYLPGGLMASHFARHWIQKYRRESLCTIPTCFLGQSFGTLGQLLSGPDPSKPDAMQSHHREVRGWREQKERQVKSTAGESPTSKCKPPGPFNLVWFNLAGLGPGSWIAQPESTGGDPTFPLVSFALGLKEIRAQRPPLV